LIFTKIVKISLKSRVRTRAGPGPGFAGPGARTRHFWGKAGFCRVPGFGRARNRARPGKILKIKPGSGPGEFAGRFWPGF